MDVFARRDNCDAVARYFFSLPRPSPARAGAALVSGPQKPSIMAHPSDRRPETATSSTFNWFSIIFLALTHLSDTVQLTGTCFECVNYSFTNETFGRRLTVVRMIETLQSLKLDKEILCDF